jgi:hypothetical protein
MLIVDTAVASLRHAVFGPQLPPEAPLSRLLAAQARAPRCTLGNAGNDAWLAIGAMIALIDRGATPLHSGTIGGAAQAPIPHPSTSTGSPGSRPQSTSIHPARPRFNSMVFPSSGSPLPFPSTPPMDMFPLPSPGSNPNARPISAVFGRTRTESAGAQANPRNSLSFNGLSLNAGPPLSVPVPTYAPSSNPRARPISMAFNSSLSGSPRNSLNLAPSPGEFGDVKGSSGTMSRSWNGGSTLGNGQPQTPLGPSGGYFDAKPGRRSKLVVSPSLKRAGGGGNESTESESDEPRDSTEEPRGSEPRGRPKFL